MPLDLRAVLSLTVPVVGAEEDDRSRDTDMKQVSVLNCFLFLQETRKSLHPRLLTALSHRQSTC